MFEGSVKGLENDRIEVLFKKDLKSSFNESSYSFNESLTPFPFHDSEVVDSEEGKGEAWVSHGRLQS